MKVSESASNFNVSAYHYSKNTDRQGGLEVADKIVKKVKDPEVVVELKVVEPAKTVRSYEKLKSYIELKKDLNKKFEENINKLKSLQTSIENGDFVGTNIVAMCIEQTNIHNKVLVPLSYEYTDAMLAELKALNEMAENIDGLEYSEKIKANRLLKPLDEEAIAINEEIEANRKVGQNIRKEIDLLNERRARPLDFKGSDLYYACDALREVATVIDHNELQADKVKLASVVSKMQTLATSIACNSKIEKFIAFTALSLLIKR